MKKFIFILLLVSSPVLAQPQNDATSRIAKQLGLLIVQIENQNDTISSLQMQLAQAQSEIKRLKEKYEPVKENK